MNSQDAAGLSPQLPPTQPKVAYLINQYPGVSHTFIRREILALETTGPAVQRYAMRGWADGISDPADALERDRTRYVLEEGALPLLAALLWALFLRPARLWAALKDAWLMSRGGDRAWAFYLVYLAEGARVGRWLGQGRIEHLHAHFGTNSAAVALLASRFSGVGFSFTVHGPEEFDKPAAISLAYKVNAARFVVAISSFGRSQIYRWIPREQWAKVKVVHCGLDRNFYANLPAHRQQRPRNDFVCVGRICEQKGQLLLVEALAQLKQRGTLASLVLAGDGPMRSLVEDRARELGVAEQIRITGWIGGEQVREELLDARVMVLPSFAEGLPVVIMEAMALRRPVISTYVAGIPELVIPGRTGWLVPPGDVDALTETLQQGRETSDDQWQALGEAGRQRVIERHSIDTEAAVLQGHFIEAIATKESGKRGLA